MAHLPPKFGPFEPLYRLGAGGMAETFVAVRRGPAGFEQRVCIKRILPAFDNDAEFVHAFLSEARTSAALRHTNIVQVLDFGIVPDEESHYLALELIDGLDLRALLHGGAVFDPELVTLVASELAAALEYAHAQEDGRASVIHRDLSPSNVLVSRAGEVKLTDFGIARVMGSAPRTATGVIKGKVPYMPPEYLEHGHFDERGDLFALGVLLFELLTGERPFDGESELDTMRRIVAGERRPIPRTGAPALLSCVERLLTIDPAQRLQSARALLDELPPIAVNPARRRLAELVRARSSIPSSSPVGALAPTQRAEPPQPEAPTRTRGRDLQALRPSRMALLVLLLSGALLAAIGAAALLRFGAGPVGASAGPPKLPTVPVATAPPAASATEERPEQSPASPAAEPSLEGSPEPSARPWAEPSSEAHGLSRQAAKRRETSARGTFDRQAQLAATSTSQGVDRRSETRGAGASAELKVVVVPFGEVWVDDKYVGQSPISIRLPAGTHSVAVGEGRARERRSVSLSAGEREQIVFRPTQPEG